MSGSHFETTWGRIAPPKWLPLIALCTRAKCWCWSLLPLESSLNQHYTSYVINAGDLKVRTASNKLGKLPTICTSLSPPSTTTRSRANLTTLRHGYEPSTWCLTEKIDGNRLCRYEMEASSCRLSTIAWNKVTSLKVQGVTITKSLFRSYLAIMWCANGLLIKSAL